VAEPSRLVAEEEALQNRAVVEVRHPTRRRVRAQRPCFCVVLRVQVAEFVACPAATGPHLQRVRQGREEGPMARSRRTSDRSAGHSLPRLRIAH